MFCSFHSGKALRPFAFVILLLASATVLAQPKTLTIFHTNDIHASFVPHEATWVRQNPKPMVGGFVELAFLVDSVRGTAERSILLDAGDVMTGNPIADVVYEGAEGGALFAMMNRLGYDAWCPGNHDFDISQENLTRLGHVAKFPMVSANLVNDKGKPPVGNAPYVIIERGGLRIGIIGIISQSVYGLVNQNNLEGIRVLSPSETLQKYIDEITPKTDLIIALTHEGVDEDSLLASQVHGVNIIVGGHSHTRLKRPLVVNSILIVQAGSNCENLGRLDVTVDDRKVVRSYGTLIPVQVHAQRPQTPVNGLVDSMQAVIERQYSEVIGTLSEDWDRGGPWSPLGVYITDAQREAAGAQVAFMNIHGIRKDLVAGPVTKRDLYEVLPFRNVLTTFQLSGSDLQKVVEYYIEKKPAIVITGLEGKWKQNADGSADILNLRVDGKQLENDKMYICTASDYFVGEAKHYIGIDLPHVIYLRQTLFGAVEQEIRKEKALTRKKVYGLQRER